ncbi:MAG TPA: methylenetetrahydrofolate reductase [NAD(P)H] [Gammaproteobacteria bacterium]|nr:methylenetetrahydrofolate reductase [NAD(P)H] [Gammaproteobacteria bacterium]
MKTQQQHTRVYSCEFFPPKTPKGEERLHSERAKLAELGPAFFSVTFGAGGTTRSGTLKTVIETVEQTGIPAAPHLSCVDATRESLLELLEEYRQADVRQIVVLRGDLPEGTTSPGEFGHANELVRFIRQHYGDRFHLEVACYPEMHPEAPGPDTDLENFARKVQEGADSAITQYFYNADAYEDFVARCEARGIDLPIVPGIMPIVGYEQLMRFSDGCGADIPRWIRMRLKQYQDDTASLQAFGIEVVTALCERLLAAGAPGLHFYTLNRADPTSTIWRNLGLDRQVNRPRNAAQTRTAAGGA